jgi:hypothetical protein
MIRREAFSVGAQTSGLVLQNVVPRDVFCADARTPT